MLLLKRRVGESIVIDHNILVSILEITTGSVKLGIDAPRSIHIARSEVYHGEGQYAKGRTMRGAEGRARNRDPENEA